MGIYMLWYGIEFENHAGVDWCASLSDFTFTHGTVPTVPLYSIWTCELFTGGRGTLWQFNIAMIAMDDYESHGQFIDDFTFWKLLSKSM